MVVITLNDITLSPKTAEILYIFALRNVFYVIYIGSLIICYPLDCGNSPLPLKYTRFVDCSHIQDFLV